MRSVMPLLVSSLSLLPTNSNASASDSMDSQRSVTVVGAAHSAQKILSEFEEALARVARLGSAELSEVVLAAAGRMEQLATAGAPEAELYRVAERARAQIAEVARRSMRTIDERSRSAASALQEIGASPAWLRLVARRQSEAFVSMLQTARWAQRLVDEQVAFVLAGK